jgi:hypothetical protein
MMSGSILHRAPCSADAEARVADRARIDDLSALRATQVEALGQVTGPSPHPFPHAMDASACRMTVEGRLAGRRAMRMLCTGSVGEPAIGAITRGGG